MPQDHPNEPEALVQGTRQTPNPNEPKGCFLGKGPSHAKRVRDLAVQPTLPEVTTRQGSRESREQGKGAQVFTMLSEGRSA
jgi:hypothetical protein